MLVRRPLAATDRPEESHAVQREFHLRSEADLPALIGGMRRLLQETACDPMEAVRMVTVASELGNNITKYALYGKITVTVRSARRRTLVELVAEDRGPGIEDIAAALTEHWSTGGGLGLGLPAVRRMVDEFHIESQPGIGARVQVKRWMA